MAWERFLAHPNDVVNCFSFFEIQRFMKMFLIFKIFGDFKSLYEDFQDFLKKLHEIFRMICPRGAYYSSDKADKIV